MAYYESLIEKADDAGIPDEVLENTKTFSDKVFSAIMDWSKKDNYAQTRSASKYTVTDEEGRWVPTPPSYTSALEAHWMEIRTLVLDSAGQCRPAPAPKFDLKDTNSVFYKATMEVKSVGDNLTDEATWGGDTVLPDSPLFGGDGVGGNAPPTFSPLNEGRVIGVELRVRR